MAALASWQQLDLLAPDIVATMRRYLDQIECILRPGSVNNADQALRAFAGFLVETAPEVTNIAQITRRHIEDYKPWLAKRPGQNKARVTTATLAHRLGTLRMFFIRIDEWGWEEAPARVPMFPGDLPRQDHPLPKALDDAAAAKLLRVAHNDKRMLVRVTIEVLLRTGLRVGEFTSLPADAVVQIGAAPWLHVPVGKLREDRYLPLHPQVRRFCAAWSDNIGPVELAAFFTDDAVYHNIPLAPVAGREAIANTIASFIRPGPPGIERIEFRVINIAADGPVVMTMSAHPILIWFLPLTGIPTPQPRAARRPRGVGPRADAAVREARRAGLVPRWASAEPAFRCGKVVRVGDATQHCGCAGCLLRLGRASEDVESVDCGIAIADRRAVQSRRDGRCQERTHVLLTSPKIECRRSQMDSPIEFVFTLPDKSFELPVMGTFEVSDGKIKAWRDYFDMNQFTSRMG